MKILISNSSVDPIYKQISDQIKKSILNESISMNSPLPSIRKLALELDVSVITIKRAYEDLEKEGFIKTVKGKGSFVAGQNKHEIHNIKMDILESSLIHAINESKSLNLTLDDMKNLLDKLYPKF